MSLVGNIFDTNGAVDKIADAISEGLEKGITNSTTGITTETEEFIQSFEKFIVEIENFIVALQNILDAVLIGVIISSILSALGLLLFIYTLFLWCRNLKLSIKVNKQLLAEKENNN